MKTNSFAMLAAAFAAVAAFAEETNTEPPKSPQSPASAEVRPLKYYGKIGQRVAALLPAKHVLQHPMDDEISRRAWTNLVSFYDFSRSVFLKPDIERLAAREAALDDELKSDIVMLCLLICASDGKISKREKNWLAKFVG